MPKNDKRDTRRRRTRAERKLVALTVDHLSHEGLPYEEAIVAEVVHFVLGQVEATTVSVLGLLRWAVSYIESAYELDREETKLLDLAKQLTEGVPEAGA